NPSKKFRTYSKGNRQKVALVAALASDVELYILDEPTSGLDPLMEAIFQQEINQLKSQGKTVLLSSHILAEVEALCDQITIIREGRVVASNTLEELQSQHRTVITATSKKDLADIAKISGVHNVLVKGDVTEFEIDHGAAGKVLDYLSKNS